MASTAATGPAPVRAVFLVSGQVRIRHDGSDLEPSGPSPEPERVTLEIEYDGELWSVRLDGEEAARLSATVAAIADRPRQWSAGRPHTRFEADGMVLRVGHDNRGDPYREGLGFDLDPPDGYGPAIFLEDISGVKRALAPYWPMQAHNPAPVEPPGEGPCPG